MRLPFLKFIDGEPVTKEEVAEMYREMAEKQALEEERLKEEALKNFSDNLGEHAGILNGLDGNPLPDSLEFKLPLQESLGDRDSSKEKLTKLKERFPQIEELVIGAPWANTAQSLRYGVQKLSFVILALVFGVVAFIVSNVVRLMLYAHREEIEIMQLVGAPRYRVVFPYLLSGAIQGLFGAIIAILVTYGIFATFLQPLNSYLVFGLSYEVFKFIGMFSILIVLFLGLLLGVGGGWFALRKWVN
jgi:cell division transport system permease protein